MVNPLLTEVGARSEDKTRLPDPLRPLGMIGPLLPLLMLLPLLEQVGLEIGGCLLPLPTAMLLPASSLRDLKMVNRTINFLIRDHKEMPLVLKIT